MKKIKILFKMFYLYHKAAYDPLLTIFQKDSKYDVAISLTHETKRKFGLINKDLTETHQREFIKQGYRISDENESFDIVVVPDVVNEARYGKALLCLVYHGITFTKTVTYRQLKKHQDYRYLIFAEGDYSVNKLSESGSLGKSEVLKVGYPKMDPYFWEGYFDRSKILNSLGLDPEKPTVLFAPTYKPTCVYDVKDAIFEASVNFNLIIKLHHYAWLGKYARHSQHRIFETRLKKYSNAIIIPPEDYNILPLLFAADTLVSEASGAITEFLATGKIGVIYNLDQLKHTDGEFLLTHDNREYLKHSFVHLNTPDDLRDAIETAFNPPLNMVKSARQERDMIFYNLDGKASERTKTEIERQL